jgi:nitrogen regulatory protein P-II 1
MKKIEAIIRPHKLEEVRQALGNHIHGMSVSEIKGFGRQRGHSEVYRGQEYKIDFVPKLRIDIVCEAEEEDRIVQIIVDSARTGKVGDGKIFVYDLDRVVRIRTGESGTEAI